MEASSEQVATPPGDRRSYEQALMRIGRRLQALGQLLEQDPARLVVPGIDGAQTVGAVRSVPIEIARLRDLFDTTVPQNIGQLLMEYHDVLARERQDTS